MEIKIVLNENLSKQAIEDISKEIDWQKEQVGDIDFQEYEISYISEIIQSKLFSLDEATTQVLIHVCGLYLGNYINSIEEWLCDLPDTYQAINDKEDFTWEFSLRAIYQWSPTIIFKYEDSHYFITLDRNQNKLNWHEEKIEINELKKIIDLARIQYLDYINKNLGSRVSNYLRKLELSFKES